ncbi:gas vesicle protein GvpO [Haladaptatus halobius]|uniref:gas vesicle protein GvpO n=1 Tax=Haladaptatus halobius TaxID=2884875 RepID=UPI001D0B9B4B|nr:gas vesicle protein GvpO [Haladaptatus halobius]
MDDSSIGELDDVIDRLADAVEESEHDTEHDAEDEVKTKMETESEIDVVDARDIGRAPTTDLVGSPLDGVVEVEDHEDRWRVVADMVERSAIPDTQDILGRYVINLDMTGNVRGYDRAGRYRRENVGKQREIFTANEYSGNI